jgi:DNA-binding XRE family transcriptional regulator
MSSVRLSHSSGKAGLRICAGCRVTRLSRYNPDVLCAACARAAGLPSGEAGNADNPSGRAPGWVWDSPMLQAALARMDLGAVMAIFRAATGLSQMEVAQLVGCSQSTIWRIEAGERGTLYDIRELLRFADAIGMPRHALLPLILGRPCVGGSEPVPADAPRRAVAPCLGLVHDPAVNEVFPARATANARYLRASADQLYAQEQTAGGGSVRAQALVLWAHARRMLDEADYADQTGRALAGAAGELAVRAGWASYDSDDQDQARRLYADALQLAGLAGDESLAVHAALSLSLQLSHLARAGRPGIARQAIWAAGQAAELARRDPSPRLHALVAAREALARAALGDDGGFRTAIARAWREMDRSPGEDDPVWLEFVRPAEITVHEAKGMVLLGHDGAADLFRSSLCDELLSPRNRAVYRAQLAAALAVGGDVGQAVTEAVVVLDALGGQLSTPRALAQLRPVRAAARRPTMAEFCDRFDAFIGTGTERLALTAGGG